MGIVYRAHDTRLNRDVAIKVIGTSAIRDEVSRKRFRKEAQALAHLNHPNIASVFEFDSHQETDFLVMELVSGATLDEKLANGPLSQKEAVRLGIQLTEGLNAAHRQGIVHRDLKPANLRINLDGNLKILDFGLAKLLQPTKLSATAATMSQTVTPAFAGTLPYMAPEQILEEETDPRTDIYAVGVVLFEMTTGRRPFLETQPSRLIESILHHAPVAPRQLNPKIAAELERIILKCLDKTPENRYQTAKEIGVDLRRLELATTGTIILPPVSKPDRRNWLAIISAAACFLLLAALGIMHWRSPSSPTVGPHAIRSLAVLPLRNVTDDASQEYFADGMTDELISDLAKISNLQVISRTSSMQYRDAHKSLPKIAQELHVDGIVEGSVLRSGDEVRINTQLIDASSDRELWSQSFQSELKDVLGLQRDVARETARQIQVALTPAEDVLLAHPKPVNGEAIEACLKGRYFWNKRTEDGFRKGIEYFKQAVAKDPNYAPAYAGLADSYLMMVEYGLMPARQGFPQAKAAAVRAVTLDDTLAEAHNSLAAVIEDWDWDWNAANKEFRRAIELNPGYATAHQWYGEFLAELGRFDSAIAETRKARDSDPLSLTANSALGEVLYESRQFDQAADQLHKTLDLDHNFAEGHRLLGVIYQGQGRKNEAIRELQQAVTLSNNSTQCAALLGRAYAVAGKKQKAEQILHDLTSPSQKEYVSPADLSVLYASLGRKDQALRLLEQAYDQRLPAMVNLKVDPALDDLRSEARFQRLLRQIGFPS